MTCRTKEQKAQLLKEKEEMLRKLALWDIRLLRKLFTK